MIYLIQSDTANEWMIATSFQKEKLEEFELTIPGTHDIATYKDSSSEYTNDITGQKIRIKYENSKYYVVNVGTGKTREVYKLLDDITRYTFIPGSTDYSFGRYLKLPLINLPQHQGATTQNGGMYNDNKFHMFKNKRYKVRHGKRGGKYINVNSKKIYIN